MSTSDASSHRFNTRITMILSVLGIAIGTGNIWRFPRIVAQNSGEDGGGSFLIAWICFLFLWSIPLIVSEYAMGKYARKGVVGAFFKTAGASFNWMGGFVVVVTTAIMFYYSVVVGWCIHYFIVAITGQPVTDPESAKLLWESFQSGLNPAFIHIFVMALGCWIVIKGIKSIEKANVILIPALMVIVMVALVRSITLPNAFEGIQFLFTPDFSVLKDPKIWLEALTQNAWDTGAGWGLILTYAAYMRSNDSVISSAVQTGLGNNIVSLLAAIIIFSTVFGSLSGQMSGSEIISIMQDSGPASTGLTFIWMPVLFQSMPFGGVLATLFFLGLSFAAFSSLLSMIEMSSRVLIDHGISRKKATLFVSGLAMIFGIPSATNLSFFVNQDFVWGLGLIISGAFVAFAISSFGAKKILDEVRPENDQPGLFYKYWPFMIRFVVPAQAILLLGWWLYRTIFEFAGDEWLNPLNPFSLATCLVQWTIALAVLIYYNKKLYPIQN